MQARINEIIEAEKRQDIEKRKREKEAAKERLRKKEEEVEEARKKFLSISPEEQEKVRTQHLFSYETARR